MKKRKVLYGLTAMLLLGSPLLAVTSCGGSDEPNVPVPPPVVNNGTVQSYQIELSLNTNTINVQETINVIPTKIVDKDGNIVTKAEFAFKSSNEDVATVNSSGTVKGLKEGTTTITVQCRDMAKDVPSEQTVDIVVSGNAAIVGGGYSYVSSENPYEDKLDILAKLEKYAVDNHLTGITLFQNGGYVMYNERIKKPTDNYITGYGFGILTEGEITKDLDAETNPDWKRYYHTSGGATNKQKFNYLDDTGSESVDLYGYITSSYYGTKMTADKKGYEWRPVLAKKAPANVAGKFDPNKPIPLNFNEGTGLATKYKVFLKTGKQDGIKFRTLSQKGEVSKFNGRDVTLDDYITPFKLLLTKKMALARSTDYISEASNSTLKGASAFYSLTDKSADLTNEEIYGKNGLFYKLVGLEPNYKENSITFTFNTPVSPFTAMTNLSSSINSPISQDFIYELGKVAGGSDNSDIFVKGMNDAYGTAIANKTDWSPVDTTLACGPFVAEKTDTNFNTFKRNDDWFEFKNEGRYKIPGVKISYYPGSTSNPDYVFERFIDAKELDSAAIPKTYMDRYVNDKRTTTTQGDSTFKLNLNTSTQKERDSRFLDPNKPTTYNGGKTWKCKPLMSNDKFVKALSFAIDRETFATSRGNIPSQSYFAPAYLWDPEAGKSYDETPQHKAVIAEYSPETYGYNETVAVRLMDEAINEEINRGSYNGIKDKETISINWMNTTDTKEFGNEIVKYFNQTFEQTEAYKNGFRIDFKNIDGTTDYQQVYNTMKAGTFDIGFGSISGMQLDPLGFLEVVKSDNSTGFTLNYGADTSIIDEENPIVYDDKKWSFDSLWTAANKGAIISKDGALVKDPVKAIGNLNVTDAEAEINGKKTPIKQLSVKLAIDIQAMSTTFKMFASEDPNLRSDEYITVSFTYDEDTVIGGKPQTLTKTGAINLYYGKGLFNDVYGMKEDGTLSIQQPIVKIGIPAVLNKDTTDGQVTSEIPFSKLKTATAYINVYMVINDVPSTSTIGVELKLI